MCLFPEENQQPVLGWSPFFRREVTIFTRRETKTHILPTKINENIAEVSTSNNNYSFRIINHSTTTGRRLTQACPLFFVRHLCCKMDPSGQPLRSAAMLRHERMTVATALAEMTHHSAPRRPTVARARGEESELNNATSQKTPHPGRQAQCTSVWTTMGTCLPPGRHLSLRCGHSGGYSGTPRSTSSTWCPWSRSSMRLCRRWRTCWWNSRRGLTR